jgi:hypothetical protein
MPLGLGISLLELPRSRSFIEEVEDGIRSSSSVYSNYTLSDSHGLEEETQLASESQDSTTAPEYASQYQEILGSTPPSTSSDVINGTLSPYTTTPYVPATPRSTPITRELSPTLSQVSSSRALTPNRLNALNEQDPAFLLAVEALRSLDITPADTPQVRSSSAMATARPESPDGSRSPLQRSLTSLGNNRKGQGQGFGKGKKHGNARECGSVKNKFSSFVDKFRRQDESDD